MCALIGAPSTKDFIEILNANRYRGEVSHSLCDVLLDGNGIARVLYLSSVPGPFEEDTCHDYPVKEGYKFLHIGHTQAPTTQSNNIHPAQYKGAMLWHNGIVKQKEYSGWDTELILQSVVDNGFTSLSDIDGTFACFLLMDERLYVFRNEISPLFYNPTTCSHFSSTKMDGLVPLNPNQVFAVEPGRLRFVAQFRTKENPYYFGM